MQGFSTLAMPPSQVIIAADWWRLQLNGPLDLLTSVRQIESPSVSYFHSATPVFLQKVLIPSVAIRTEVQWSLGSLELSTNIWKCLPIHVSQLELQENSEAETIAAVANVLNIVS